MTDRGTALVRTRPSERFADDVRVRAALQQLRSAVREMTPAARIRSRPFAWIAAGFAVGVGLAWWWRR